MANEQEMTVAALKTSLQMEIDGKKFYEKSSKSSKNQLGRELLKKLAAEEDVHRSVFQNIFNNIKNQKGWPDVTFTGDHGQALKNVFAKAIEDMDRNVKSIGSEIDAVQTAMEMENKTYDFYKKRSGEATEASEKQFYESLSMQESEHHKVLLDYYEFLKNPETWYVQKEHTSVDGG
jgi:rubrerythrin